MEIKTRKHENLRVFLSQGVEKTQGISSVLLFAGINPVPLPGL